MFKDPDLRLVPGRWLLVIIHYAEDPKQSGKSRLAESGRNRCQGTEIEKECFSQEQFYNKRDDIGQAPDRLGQQFHPSCIKRQEAVRKVD